MNVIKEDILKKDDLLKIYRILKVYNEGLIINPSEDWEVDIYNDIIADKKGLDALLEKIEELLPFSEREKIKKQILRRRYDTFNNEIDENAYEKIEKAFNQQKTVEIGYFDMKSAEIRTREISIYYKSRKYIIAYCHLRKDLRKFRTSRIVTVNLIDKTYEIPNNFNKNEFL